jgi:23S rRNA (cytidine1920-2'-O)/16S rRNA (cytidine1409-2'-O)-methyltransferase
VDKPGTATKPESALRLIGDTEPFVSRAGRKLAAALDHFLPNCPALDPAGKICLDVGASTGGFTDCLLQRGAVRVYAVDVGYGQLDARLRNDPRVVVRERVNARFLSTAEVPEACELGSIDVSFISLTKVVPALLPLLVPGGWLLALIKPQFEAGRHQVGKGGIVRDPEVRTRVIADTATALAVSGFELVGAVDSEVPGVGGNREAFALLRRPMSGEGER